MAASWFALLVVVGFVGSLAFGVVTAWLVAWKTRRPKLWLLTPLFALLWLVLLGGSVALLGTVGGMRYESRRVEREAEAARIKAELVELGRAAHEAAEATQAGDAAAGAAGENR